MILFCLAACAGNHQPQTLVRPGPGLLTDAERINHVLNRLAYGPRPGDAERVAAMGIEQWIDTQLRPETIPDSALDVALAPLPPWTTPPRSLAIPDFVTFRATTTVAGVRVPPDTMEVRLAYEAVRRPTFQFLAGKVIRAQVSERQLLEVMTEFWENHFSVYSGKMPAQTAPIIFDRETVRPHAFGKFRTLLGAVAKSPAMLHYLDNRYSVVDSTHMSMAEYADFVRTGERRIGKRTTGVNENYARELLELHTLGVDGGYTQADVIDVARAFTGWGFDPRQALQVGLGAAGTPPLAFQFLPGSHDADLKTVFGRTLGAGRGMEDGEEVLDILARHPSTARFIATKLVRRFVSDNPPQSLVARAAATFTRTDGNIADVLRTIVTSEEFFARSAFRAKAKTPFELLVSVRRVLGALPDTSFATLNILGQLGQPIFGKLTPEGWPDIAAAWMNPGAMAPRFALGADAAAGKLPFAPLEAWVGWSMLSTAQHGVQVDGVISLLLGGATSPATRAILLQTDAPVAGGTSPKTTQDTLRELIELAISSPDFQRR